MPPSPPASPSTTDSIRNCDCTCLVRAPTAMRMPISRVRSVTETSMMFMIPMPPTSSETAAIPPSSSVITCVVACGRVGHVRQVPDGEVVRLARADVVPVAQNAR